MLLTGWLVVLLAAAVASAQTSDVIVTVQPNDIGLGGIVRPGTWTPLLVTLENRSAKIRKVRCQWVLSDIDGDRVQAHRSLVLTPQHQSKAWLYAVPPYNTGATPDWRVQVIDEESGKLLASQRLVIGTKLAPEVNMIGVTSSMSLDLRRFADNLTQHEKILFIRSLDPGLLPDRWYGFDGLQALIWTPDSPIGRLIHSDGYILALGVTHESSTAYHVAEESGPALCNDPFGNIDRIVCPDGSVEEVWGLAFRSGLCPVSLKKLDETLDRRKLQERGKVGNADCELVKALDLWKVRREHLRKVCPGCRVTPRYRDE